MNPIGLTSDGQWKSKLYIHYMSYNLLCDMQSFTLLDFHDMKISAMCFYLILNECFSKNNMSMMSILSIWLFCSHFLALMTRTISLSGFFVQKKKKNCFQVNKSLLNLFMNMGDDLWRNNLISLSYVRVRDILFTRHAYNVDGSHALLSYIICDILIGSGNMIIMIYEIRGV